MVGTTFRDFAKPSLRISAIFLIRAESGLAVHISYGFVDSDRHVASVGPSRSHAAVIFTVEEYAALDSAADSTLAFSVQSPNDRIGCGTVPMSSIV